MSEEEFGGMSAMAMAATSMHEMYSTYIQAGFSEEQSLRIVLAIVQAGLGRAA